MSGREASAEPPARHHAHARPDALQRFLDRLRDAIVTRTETDDAARPIAERVFGALERPGDTTADRPERLPVCAHLDASLASAAAASADLAALADAFAALEPSLRWRRRAGADGAARPFRDAHANAVLIGTDGLEARDDVWIGCSLVAPNIRYPDHRHPPPEVYLVLSPGEWRSDGRPWWTPGPGGIVHNPPDVVHAMRSGAAPLFAFWCLPIDV